MVIRRDRNTKYINSIWCETNAPVYKMKIGYERVKSLHVNFSASEKGGGDFFLVFEFLTFQFLPKNDKETLQND